MRIDSEWVKMIVNNNSIFQNIIINTFVRMRRLVGPCFISPRIWPVRNDGWIRIRNTCKCFSTATGYHRSVQIRFLIPRLFGEKKRRSEDRRGKISGVGGRNEGNEISAGRWTRINAAAFTRANSGSDTTDAVSSRSNGRNEAENWPTFRHGRHLPPFNQNSENRFVSLFSELP